MTPATSPNSTEMFGEESGAVTRSNENEEMESWCWESVLCSDPEMLIRQASRSSENEDESPLAIQHRLLDERLQTESLKNPTAAMITQMNKMEERERERQTMSWKEQLQHLTNRKQTNKGTLWNLTPNPLTPAMEEVIAMRQKRISVDIDIPITPEPSDSDDDSDDEDIDENVGNGHGVEYDDDSDDNSSHEEYVPTSGKKTVLGINGDQKRELAPRSPATRKTIDFDHHPNGVDRVDGASPIDKNIMKFVLEDGISIAEQREALKMFRKKKLKMEVTKAPVTPNGTPTNHSQFHAPSKHNGTFSRRVSIQNESVPSIRNKDSPPDNHIPVLVPTLNRIPTAAKNRAVEKWVTTNHQSTSAAPPPKRLSCFSEERSFAFKEVPAQGDDKDDGDVPAVRETRARAKKSTNQPESEASSFNSKKSCLSKRNGINGHDPRKAKIPIERKKRDHRKLSENGFDEGEPSTKRRNGKLEPPVNIKPAAQIVSKKGKGKAKVGLRSGHSTRSRGGVAIDDKWKWNEVIFSNPEKMLRKKIKA